jgi:two-component system OmpR family response regulator
MGFHAMSEGAGRRPLVLLAEDDDDIRGIFEMILAERYEVLTAQTGEDALRIAAESRPDVVLLDWTLPDLLGDEVVARLRKLQGPTAPIVVVSGANSVDALAARVGAIPCAKPCEIEQLVRAIELALGRRGAQGS